MSSDIYYDDSELRELFHDLEPKMRMKAFRAGFMRAARKVRNRAVSNLRESGIKSNSRLERKIRASMLRRGGAGFKVTIQAFKKSGMYKNRFGKLKPVLPWLERGTAFRYTRKNHAYRGFIHTHGFMGKTKAETAGTVTEEVRDNIRNCITEIAKKHGCK